MRKILAIAKVTILESFRRKDPYVVLILAFLIVLGAGLFARFGIEGLGKFVKDVAFTAVKVFSSIICVVAAARQMPVELQNRTLYPLLAKPVSRSYALLGKYIGVVILSTLVIIFFAIELLILFYFLGIKIEPIFFQAIYLQALSVWFIAALTILLSLHASHGATVTISLLLVLAMNTFSNALLAVHTELTGISKRIAEVIYWIAPHLELFDLSKKVIHEWPPVPMWVLLALTGYALVYGSIVFFLALLKFRHMDL